MSGLLWMRACNRGTAEEQVRLLRDGDEPPPPHLMTGTKQLELDLDICPHRVYYFLGRTLEAFGRFAYAVNLEACEGAEISPCDTGGLVGHISPVCSWQAEAKQEYLQSITWDHGDLPVVLQAYPGSQPAAIDRYLDSTQKPIKAGPHAIWDRVPEAAIWEENDDWRSWTWEARPPGPIITGSNIVAWSCAPAVAEMVMDAILKESESQSGSEPPAWALHLIDTYVDGGVGPLVNHLRHYQSES